MSRMVREIFLTNGTIALINNEGVTYDPNSGKWERKNKWRAEIQVNGKKVYLGRYTTAEEAYQIYLDAHQKYFGEYSWVK